VSPEAFGSFHVEVMPAGNLLLRGELDMATVQDLQDKIDGIMVPGQAIVLDLAQLTFLDTSAIHCFIRAEAGSGHPVVLMNASRGVRRILELAGLGSQAWVFDGHGPAPASDGHGPASASDGHGPPPASV
jgi:anti-anti-sigma factor